MKVSIRFARAFEPSGKVLVSAKVEGSCFHDFEETLKELVTAHFLCITSGATGTSSVQGLRSKSSEELNQSAECMVLESASTAALEEQCREPAVAETRLRRCQDYSIRPLLQVL